MKQHDKTNRRISILPSVKTLGSLAGLLLAVQLVTVTFAAADPIPLSENGSQPIRIAASVDSGILLLCERGDQARFGVATWGCFSSLGIQHVPSDSVEFTKDAFGAGISSASFCSDPDAIADNDDSCAPKMTGQFAILEVGTERIGPEVTPYDSPGNAFSGFGMMGTAFITYTLTSDSFATPEPSSVLLFWVGLLVIVSSRRPGVWSTRPRRSQGGSVAHQHGNKSLLA